MKKTIIFVFIVFIVLVIGVVYYVSTKESERGELTETEKTCIDSGGTVAIADCCKLTSDFPNSCLIGACGCSSDNSKQVKTCDCKDGCWDGTKCVKSQIFPIPVDTSDWQVYTNPKYAYTMKYPSDWTAEHDFGLNEILGYGYYESNVFSSSNGYALAFSVVPKNGDVVPVPRTGVGEGDFVDSDETIMIGDTEVGMKKLVFKGKVKELFINDFEINAYKGKAYVSYFGKEKYDDFDMNDAEEVKVAKAILESFELAQSSRIGDFCGRSTNGQCSSDADCITGGCSGQVCQSKNEEPIITTCEYRDCYNPQPYGLTCGCKASKCQWK
jgi:eight-cysteine-cluster-containing protein